MIQILSSVLIRPAKCFVLVPVIVIIGDVVNSPDLMALTPQLNNTSTHSPHL